MKKLLLLILILIPFVVYADSGFDASYNSSSSDIVGSLTSLISPVTSLLGAEPGSEDYTSYHIILSVICIITLYIFTNIYLFRLLKKTKTIIKLLISLIPTIIFSLLCFLTNLQLFIYLLILILYILIFKLVTSIITKIRFKNNMKKVLSIDKNYNTDDINKEVFNIYKDIQIAWMNFELNKVKNVISEDIYNEYTKQLDKLKKDNEKNIMDNIEYKSNKITDISIDNNIEEIECLLNVTCIDYIVDNEDNVIKGKKDKVNDYTYKLIFNKNIKNNKYVLIKKKITKQK